MGRICLIERRSGSHLCSLNPAQSSNLGAEEAMQPVWREQRRIRPDVYLISPGERHSMLIYKLVIPEKARMTDQRG